MYLPKFYVSTDSVILNKFNNQIKVLLIKRKNYPWKEMFAMPGGFVEENEDLIDAAKRELEEETGLKNIDLLQFKAYGDPYRDPRGRVVTIVYYGFLEDQTQKIKANDDAADAKWFPISNLPSLAADHKQILEDLFLYLGIK